MKEIEGLGSRAKTSSVWVTPCKPGIGIGQLSEGVAEIG